MVIGGLPRFKDQLPAGLFPYIVYACRFYLKDSSSDKVYIMYVSTKDGLQWKRPLGSNELNLSSSYGKSWLNSAGLTNYPLGDNKHADGYRTASNCNMSLHYMAEEKLKKGYVIIDEYYDGQFYNYTRSPVTSAHQLRTDFIVKPITTNINDQDFFLTQAPDVVFTSKEIAKFTHVASIDSDAVLVPIYLTCAKDKGVYNVMSDINITTNVLPNGSIKLSCNYTLLNSLTSSSLIFNKVEAHFIAAYVDATKTFTILDLYASDGELMEAMPYNLRLARCVKFIQTYSSLCPDYTINLPQFLPANNITQLNPDTDNFIIVPKVVTKKDSLNLQYAVRRYLDANKV